MDSKEIVEQVAIVREKLEAQIEANGLPAFLDKIAYVVVDLMHVPALLDEAMKLLEEARKLDVV